MPADPVPVVDLFAGCGGLGEGFARYPNRDEPAFEVRLSVESDAAAADTLRLREFYRRVRGAPGEAAYWEELGRANAPAAAKVARLYDLVPAAAAAAREAVLCEEISPATRRAVRARVAAATAGRDDWVLLGGPPCQAYSLAGRARRSGMAGYRPEKDPRQYLWNEFLHVVAAARPAAFVLENVKGLLSAKLHDERVFKRMLDDLRDPPRALFNRPAVSGESYRTFAVAGRSLPGTARPEDYAVEMEQYGVPQSRHRLIVVGIRSDHQGDLPVRLQKQHIVPAGDVMGDLPPVRSRLSREEDSLAAWKEVVRLSQDIEYASSEEIDRDVRKKIRQAAAKASEQSYQTGAEVMPWEAKSKYQPGWYANPSGYVFNHTARGHMRDDIHRYIYAAAFGEVFGSSPKIVEFPESLRPNHRNVDKALSNHMFADRFRVQVAAAPAKTITSHLAKDGHSAIHPDPAQARSLTAREAARLQTFSDDCFFCGPRTSQYKQIGNAVPPLLSYQLAAVIHGCLQLTDGRQSFEGPPQLEYVPHQGPGHQT